MLTAERKNAEFHHNGIQEVLAFSFAITIILLRMKLGIVNLDEFSTISTFINEMKFTIWARTPKQLLGAGEQ